ncbi:MAG: hypothetical protein P8177_11495 [Gemmatimonadota bacterium]|jgi:hypothetical protein
MSHITGIFVSLTTSGVWWAGTNDHLYVGVVGTVGGREFALAVRDFDDFEEGTVVPYSIGPGAAVFGGRIPDTAASALNDMTICLPNVTHVYLRKQGDRTHEGDDAWRLASAYVYLISSSQTRVFSSTGAATLGNEHGLQLWLGEVAHSGTYRNARIPIDGVASCGSDG